ncbi:MAG TPA: acetate uptake transporter [Amycolatopsis sp.]|uniref:acetate uptake transporter n=1 Tax=Amycolatopsis sp. TaxID=37632 RepID=UPI002B4973FA|nr:acetate uptake transporter [Amycolatopsis sp.]HKS47520.1 acetate uptake transporter [Amycolatopsis sp.]
MTSAEYARPAPPGAAPQGPPLPRVGEPAATGYAPTASGVPLALAGFGFSLTILSLANTGIVDMRTATMFVPVALGTGALAMLVGGLWEFRANNLFGATFCSAYACFLLTTALILQFYGPTISTTAGPANFSRMFGAYLIVWALFTAMLAVGARVINAPAFIAFVLLVAVYVLLGIANLLSGPAAVALTKAGGWVGLADSLAAFYLCSALVLNDVSGRYLLPVWPSRRTAR